MGASVAEELAKFLLVICNIMFFHQVDECRTRVPGQCRFAKVWILRDEVLGLYGEIGEITSASPRDTYLLPYPIIVLNDENRAASFARLDRTHESGGSAAYYDNVSFQHCQSKDRKKAAQRTSGGFVRQVIERRFVP